MRDQQTLTMAFQVHHDDESTLRVVFDGVLDGTEGRQSADLVASTLAAGPRKLVFDVGGMTGYHRDARSAWQHTLWPHRDAIQGITLVGGNKVIQMGASLLAMFLGVPLTKLDSEAH
jgi:hypothetical protein